MSKFTDTVTGFTIADPNITPFNNTKVTLEEVQNALKPMILSASGWRKVFAKGGDEEDTTEEISNADKVLSAAMAKVFADFVKVQSKKENPTVVVSQDSRHTGSAIADTMIRVFISEGIGVEYLFISAAPETFAYTKKADTVDGFAYISASHNPIGHNGVKFGLKTGGVIDGSLAMPLIEDFKTALSTQESIDNLINFANRASSDTVLDILKKMDSNRKKAQKAYFNFTNEVISGSDNPKEQKSFIANLKSKISNNGFGIIAEFNGSARTLTIDSEYLNSLGVKVKRVNDKPREITHRIVPEGRSLNLCREILEEENKKDTDFVLGYVPDNDGDRGNVVFYNEESKKAEIIEAQTVFAISVLSELAAIHYNGNRNAKCAVAVNGPTSMRIDDIANVFDAEVFRAEVGEANVVNLAELKRKEGYLVRILGEGSNGGNITYPAAVRDPLNTISAIMKLLVVTSDNTKPGLFELWCQKSGQMDKYKENFTLVDIINTLPKYVTTSAYEDRALFKITTDDHAILKNNYEKVFAEEWEAKKAELKEKFDIVDWIEINSEGTKEVEGVGPQTRTGKAKGGFKIILKDSKGQNSAYLWMRGSGTEPVFRVLVDSKSDDPAKEEYLLNWHTSIIAKADSM